MLLFLLPLLLLSLPDEESRSRLLYVLRGLALLEMGPPVVLDLVVGPPREASSYVRPPTCAKIELLQNHRVQQ